MKSQCSALPNYEESYVCTVRPSIWGMWRPAVNGSVPQIEISTAGRILSQTAHRRSVTTFNIVAGAIVPGKRPRRASRRRDARRARAPVKVNFRGMMTVP